MSWPTAKDSSRKRTEIDHAGICTGVMGVVCFDGIGVGCTCEIRRFWELRGFVLVRWGFVKPGGG